MVTQEFILQLIASLSCPDLHNEAFVAERINMQLDNDI